MNFEPEILAPSSSSSSLYRVFV